ncbi:uncharacterized protein LOC119641420 [Glossina fuscipes]|uniref:Uncharacterized protein LOC119641420 n=1 Tax=Glossina fuscipes TaxID=7396 RepID=A0A9C5ZAL4_9MUSC|nr:uncharacterized protein LOC119641420 [Glossina fuscipes]
MRKLMNERERRTYIIEKVDLDLVDYFTNCTICARRLILKETDDTIPTARRHMKVMWCVDRFFKALFFFGLLYYLYYYFFDRLSSGETVIQKPLE